MLKPVHIRLPLLSMLCLAPLPAVDWKALQPQGYVSDFAGVVDAASKERLAAYCARVEQAAGAQIALVTITTLEGEPVEDVANTIFRAWGVGQKKENNGILLLLAVQDHRSRLEVGYGLEPHIPDGFAGGILREMRPALRQGQYGEALIAAAQTIGETVAKAKGVALDTRLERRIRPRPADGIPWPVILGGIFMLIWLMRAGRGGGGGILPALILGNLMGRATWGSRGGGGFGGFDSGDSFGGFGGGDSGGGGASSDW